jgi:predicted site-specific integrase-resolvase
MSKPKIDGYLSEEELAAQLGVVPRTLKRWRMRGQGPPFTRIVRRPVYRIESVRKWLQSRERVMPREAAE